MRITTEPAPGKPGMMRIKLPHAHTTLERSGAACRAMDAAGMAGVTLHRSGDLYIVYSGDGPNACRTIAAVTGNEGPALPRLPVVHLPPRHKWDRIERRARKLGLKSRKGGVDVLAVLREVDPTFRKAHILDGWFEVLTWAEGVTATITDAASVLIREGRNPGTATVSVESVDGLALALIAPGPVEATACGVSVLLK